MLRLFRPQRLHDEQEEYIYYHMPMEHLKHTDAEDEMDLSDYIGQLCDLNRYGGEWARDTLKHRSYYSIFIVLDPNKQYPEYTINYGLMAAILPKSVSVDYLLEVKKVACSEIRIEAIGGSMTVMTPDHAEKLAFLLSQNPEAINCINQLTVLPQSPELMRVLTAIRASTRLNYILDTGSGDIERFYGHMMSDLSRELNARIRDLDDPVLYRENLKNMWKSTQLISIALTFIKPMDLEMEFLGWMIEQWRSEQFIEDVKRSQLVELFYVPKYTNYLEVEFGVDLTTRKSVTVRHPVDRTYKLKLIKTKPYFCDYMFRLIYEM